MHDAHIAELRVLHPEIGDAPFNIDCAADGYQLHFPPSQPEAPKTTQPAWAQELAAKIEAGES